MRQLGAAGPGCPRQQSLPRWRSFNPLSRRAGSIAPPLGPPGRAGVEHWYGAVRCVSVDPVLSGCVIQIALKSETHCTIIIASLHIACS